MFTHRICCCSAAVASQVVALVAILVVAGQAAFSWSYGNPLPLDIYQTVMVAIEMAACVLVFVACCTTRPVLVLPIIITQVWNCLNVIAICVYSLCVMWGSYDALSYVFVIVFYLLGLLLSNFFLHCHICCYRLLVFERIQAHNRRHCAHDNYVA